MVSATADAQLILVSLSTADLVVEPGDVAHLMVTMTNGQESADRLTVEVEGIDVEWYAIPVPAVYLAPGAQSTERIIFRVARSGANRAGTYPFIVRIQAMETGEVGVAQATLQVKPFSDLHIELSPKRATATFLHRDNSFDVTVTNSGNSEEALELYAGDPEDACAYEFDTDRIILKPGHSRTVELSTEPKSVPMLAATRLYGFTVSVRSTEDSYVSANAHGQIEKHALISPLFGIFLLLLGLVASAWAYYRPRPLPPLAINSFVASPTAVLDGSPTKLAWDVAQGFRQILIVHRVGPNGTLIPDGQSADAVGTMTVQPQQPYTVYTLVVRGAPSQKEINRDVKVYVSARPAAPRPALRSFAADTPVAHVGDKVTLTWDGINEQYYILDPPGQHLQPVDNEIQVTPDTVGDFTYKLRAIGFPNSPGQMPPLVKRTVHIRVVAKDQSIAQIDSFRAPATVYKGEPFRLRWKTSYARKGVQIQSDNGTPIVGGSALPPSGAVTVTANDPTTFTLTALDSAGLPVSQTVTVVPKDKPLPPPPPAGADGTQIAPPNGAQPNPTQPQPTTPPGGGVTPAQPGTNP